MAIVDMNSVHLLNAIAKIRQASLNGTKVIGENENISSSFVEMVRVAMIRERDRRDAVAGSNKEHFNAWQWKELA